MAEENIQSATEETTAESGNKKKRKTEYHLMLFIDKADGGIHQMGIGRWFIELVAGILALVLIVTIAGWSINSHYRKVYSDDNFILNAKIEELETKVGELTTENASLSDKVNILSNTVNTKVEQENAIQEEVEAVHYPEGFPLSASASMSADENDIKCIIFSGNEGSSIIASGAGKVIEVLPDPDWGYCIRIDHDNGYVTEYYNGSTPLIKEGDEVTQGAILAVIEKDHTKLAYKIKLDDEQIDPMTIIKIDG